MNKRTRTFLVVLFLMPAFLTLIFTNTTYANNQPPTILTVNTTLDTDNEECTVVQCSLREAFSEASFADNDIIIQFDIGTGFPVINLTDPLTLATNNDEYDVTIEGNTGGATKIVLNGAGIFSGNVLEIYGADNIIRDLVVQNGPENGILVRGHGNILENNYIGTDETGMVAAGNAGHGIRAEVGDDIQIGTAGNGNLIANNGGYGISIDTDVSVYIFHDTLIQGNTIGTNLAQTVAMPNQAGGIYVGRAYYTNVGGTGVGEGNVIAGNGGWGIQIRSNALQTRIFGNFIGTNEGATHALGNGDGGILDNKSVAVWVGDGSANSGNVIAYNGGAGVRGADEFVVRGNRIYENAGMGIDFGDEGIDLNEPLIDIGVDDSPEIQAVAFDLSTITITGTINSKSNVTRTLEFFASPSCDAGVGFGQGAEFLGSHVVQTDGAGNADFSVALPVSVPMTSTVTATASDMSNTSEFSRCFPEPFAGISQTFVVTSSADAGAGSLRQAISLANQTSITDTITFNIPGAGVRTLNLLTQLPPLLYPTIIDGLTQAGATCQTPQIELNGAALGGDIDDRRFGLRLFGGNNTVRGLVINRFVVGVRAQYYGGNTLTCNFVGTNSAGTSALGFHHIGIEIEDSPGNQIGGVNGDGNLVAGGNAGILVQRINMPISYTVGNVVQGNRVGTDVSGSYAIPATTGIVVEILRGTLVGGTEGVTPNGACAGACNLVSGNIEGIFVDDAPDNVVAGNFVGTNISGTGTIPNFFGIMVGRDSQGTMIGGAEENAGNLVSGNDAVGIYMGYQPFFSTDEVFGAIVQGNRIGLASDGTPLGNVTDGVLLSERALDNVVTGNHIAHNGANGINVVDYFAISVPPATPLRNILVGNQIHDNNLLGIDLDDNGVTLNDADDTDGGVHELLNYPVINLAMGGAGLEIAGILEARPTTTYTLHFYSNTACDASGFGEGEHYVGMGEVFTDGNGDVAYSFSLTETVPAGHFLTATTTDVNAGTSEFSACQVVLPAPIVVNTNQDVDDGMCDGTHCSLREAIALANSQPLTDTITFDPAITPTIVVSGFLPAITDTVVLDGDVNGVKLVLDGATSTGDGLTLNANNSTIRNFVIHSFVGNGLTINGSGNEIAGNLIGVDPTGQIDMGNLRGIHLQSGGYNQIGGTTESDRNIISGNTGSGIWLDGADVFSNTIQGNFIGTNISGTVDLGSDNHGIAVDGSGYNLIGGTVGNTPGGNCTGACNVISGNGNGGNDAGIWMDGTSRYNQIIGNYIGTDVSGTQDLGNRDGIYTGTGGSGPDYLKIGGSTPAERNIISGNNRYGIYLTSDTNFPTVQGNYIGTDVTGMVALPNAQLGFTTINTKNLLLGGTEGVTVGGACTGVCNLISGNGSNTSHHGAWVDGFPNESVVQGNFFGVDVTGMNALPNTGMGLRIEVENGVMIGGDTLAARNIFAGNGSHGLHVTSANGVGTSLIQNNYMGVNSAGTATIPNGLDGMALIRCYSCLVRDNVSAGNARNGIYIDHSIGDTIENAVHLTNNLIGVLPDGVTAAGNGDDGVEIYGTGLTNVRTRYIYLGGLNTGEGNVIANNGGHGVHFSNKRVRDNFIQGNFIGTDATGTLSMGNAGHGIYVNYEIGYATGNTIEQNMIVHNGLDGIAVVDRPYNTIRANSIYDNGGLGIDLNNDGVTANDVGDVDGGANEGLNYPEILTAWNRAGGTRIAGTFHTISNTFTTLEFYASTLCDGSGYGEGERYLGSVDVLTNDLGNVNFSQLFTLVPEGEFVVATATDANGNTSEFSACEQVTAASGAIAGTVSNQVPIPVAGAEVTVYQNLGTVISPTWSLLDVVTVAVDGGYEMPALFTGNYALYVSDPSQIYAPEYYNDAGQWDAITPISVTDGITTTNVNVVLAFGGEITGTVTLTDGTPLQGIVVVGLRENAGIWEIANSATTDISGTYRIGGLASGDYRAYFYDPSGVYGSEYYSDTTSFDTADIFTVTVATTTPHINAVLDNVVPIMTATGDCVINIDDNGQWVVRIRKAGSRVCQTVVETPLGLVTCAGVDVPANVRFVVGVSEFVLVENAGIYTGLITIDGNGNPDLSLHWDCGGNPQTVAIGGVQLYDPSGFVTDSVTGDPIVGATVTLYQVPNWRGRLSPADNAPHTCQSNLSKAAGDPWNQPAPTALGQFAPPFSGIISPTINAQLTDHDGYYGWDVAEGCWYVTVKAAGYLDLVSPVVGVPTEVTDLDLQLTPFAVDVDVLQGVGDSLDLSWQPNFATSCTYNLYQGNTPYFDLPDGTLVTSTPTQTANVGGVVGDPNTNYFFRVEAVGCADAGDVVSGVVGEFDFGINAGIP